MNREDLPDDADNYDVWCERCQKTHRYWTFTRQDYDRILAEQVARLTQSIDDEALRQILAQLGDQ